MYQYNHEKSDTHLFVHHLLALKTWSLGIINTGDTEVIVILLHIKTAAKRRLGTWTEFHKLCFEWITITIRGVSSIRTTYQMAMMPANNPIAYWWKEEDWKLLTIWTLLPLSKDVFHLDMTCIYTCYWRLCMRGNLKCTQLADSNWTSTISSIDRVYI